MPSSELDLVVMAAEGQDLKVVLALLRQHFKQCAADSGRKARDLASTDVPSCAHHGGRRDAFEEAERLMITLSALKGGS